MGRRRRPDLTRTSALAVAGMAAGAVLAVALIATQIVRRAAPTPAEEPETTASPVPAPELQARGLLFPVQGVAPESITDSFDDPRSGGRRHHALDIMAPRGTPVLAVEDGQVLRLMRGASGGITVYQSDPTSRYGYYYAHLDRYADGLADGATVRRGQVLGYVGSTGNARPSAPHLHFAVFERTDARRWWTGRPVDPFLLWKAAGLRSAAG